MKADIAGGLKNALEKGDSLEDAVQSFLNAGYGETEVREASKMVNISNIPTELSKTEGVKKLPSPIIESKPKKRFKLNLVSVLLIVLVLLVLFFLASLFFQQEIINFFSSFLS